MSSPTVSVLSMGHLGGHQGGAGGGGGAPKVTIQVGGRRGSASSDMLFERRGSAGSDLGMVLLRRGSGDYISDGRRGSAGSEGGGGGGRTGGVQFSDDKNSVFSSSSYAASRGLQRTSPSRPISVVDVPQPTVPPRAKGPTANMASFLSSPTKATGIMKSSSEIFISSPGAAPSKGILKSSSGILKTSNNVGSALSKSPSGGAIPTGNRVNFSDTVRDIDNVLGSAPSQIAPSSEAPPGPTGRTLTRQPEEVAPQTQQPPPRKKAEATSHSVFYPRAQHPQQKETQQKGTQHPQPKETLPQLQQKGTQHPQHRDVDRNNDLQQQVKILQQKEKERSESKASSHVKFQQTKESDSQAILKLKQQNQQQLQQQQQEILKQQQRSQKIDIPEVRNKLEEYQRDQQFQQLIRAGSLGSGEPAAILQQRSRSPLPSTKKSSINDKQVIPPITVHANSHTSAERKISIVNNFKAQEFTVQEAITKPESVKATDRAKTNTSIVKHIKTDSNAKSAVANTVVVSGTAPTETRSGTILASAKAYTENFQSYSYSSYLTKTRKDSVPSKDSSTLSKELQEGSPEIKQSPPNSHIQNNSSSPQASTHNNTARPYTRGTAGKIIVPLEPFIPANPTKGPTITNDVPVLKQQTAGEKVVAVHKLKKSDQPKETPIQKLLSSKANNRSVKSNASGQETPSKQQQQQQQQQKQQQASPKATLNQKDLVKTTREKPISSSTGVVGSTATAVKNNHKNTPAPPSKRESKSTSPILTNFKLTLSEKMKGSSEGLLLVACREAEEDQVLRLLKELTATGSIDAATLNQTDKAGRTSLSYSCANAFLRIVESLTSMPGLDINKPDSDGNTPLHFASQAGHTEIVSHLVNKCNRTVDLDARNALGFTPLMKAALQGRTKIAKILLFAGASPHLRDFGRGLCAVEWARYTGRHMCSELIDSVQKSCSTHIKERWTSDPDLKSHSSSSINTLGQGDNKESWIKHKIKKAFHKSESKKEFSVVTNLSTMAVCATSPLLPTAVTKDDLKPHQVVVPHVQITEVKVPDCYEDPEDIVSRLPPPPPPPVLPPEESASSSKSPKKQPKNTSAPSTSSTSSSSNSSATASGTTTTPPAATTTAAASATTSTSSSSSSSTTATTSTTTTAPTVTTTTTTTSSPPSSGSVEESQGGVSAGDSKSNGTAKSIVSSSKLPFSNNKKRK